MRTAMRFASLTFAAVLSFACTSTTTRAQAQTQAPAPAPTAPVPAQILSAQKVFIANGAGESPTGLVFNDPTYDEFYAGIKSWGHYTLAASPSDADLVLQVSCSWYQSRNISGYVAYNSYLRVLVIDPKTGTHLWGFSEEIQPASRKIKPAATYEDAMTKLLADVKTLATTPAAKI
jgi:hypothetical protein